MHCQQVSQLRMYNKDPTDNLDKCQLPYHSTLLQQVCLDHCATDLMPVVEVDLNQLAKPAAVGVPLCLGIAKCLKNRVSLHAVKQTHC